MVNDEIHTPTPTSVQRPGRWREARGEPSIEVDVSIEALATEAARPSAPARRFGRYELLGRLAVGGMAEIYLAREVVDGEVERVLVIKLLKSDIAEHEDFVLLFRDEARLATQLRHPYIAHVYECGQIDGRHYIAMEWVKGVSLASHVRRLYQNRQRVPLPIALRIVCDVAEALDYAHRATSDDGSPLHVVHRDVSPQNIVISYDGIVKLLDFGIAKARSRLTSTQSGTVRGKFAYMSPEQCEGNERIDWRSDIFSLGVVLHELVTGQALFERSSDVATMMAVADFVIPPPHEIDPKTPILLSGIVMRALAREPDRRFQTARELQEELQRFLVASNEMVSSGRVGDHVREVWSEELGMGTRLTTQTDFLASLPAARPTLTPTPVISEAALPKGRGKRGKKPKKERENRGFAFGASEIIATVLMALLVGWLVWPSAEAPGDKGGPKPVGTVTIESDPPGATVKHGDDVLGVTPLVIETLPIGNETLVLELAGHTTEAFQVAVRAEPSTVTRRLRALPTE
jgi:serine/threonine-protein kinase